MWHEISFVILIIFCAFGLVQSISDSCLSDLSLMQVVKIKQTLNELTCSLNTCASRNSTEIQNRNLKQSSTEQVGTDGLNFQALPLVGTNIRRSYDEWDEKPSKLQSAFQLSITALSFLAFGGYLLCMIVQAIKSKGNSANMAGKYFQNRSKLGRTSPPGTTYFHPTTMTNGENGNVFRKKVKYYRNRRFASTRRNSTRNNRSKEATLSPDEMYKIMIQLAEGYVKMY